MGANSNRRRLDRRQQGGDREIQRSACLRRKRTRRRHLSRNEQGEWLPPRANTAFHELGRPLASPTTMQETLPSQRAAPTIMGNMLRMGRKTSLVTSPDDLTAAYLAQRSLPHRAMFIRTSLLRHRPYQTQYRIVADWEQQVWELVLHNASYQHLNAVVARFDANGVSNTQREKSDKERRQIHDTLFSRSLTASLNGRDKYEKRLFLHHNQDIPVGVCTETHGAAHQMDAAFITVGTVFSSCRPPHHAYFPLSLHQPRPKQVRQKAAFIDETVGFRTLLSHCPTVLWSVACSTHRACRNAQRQAR